MMRALYSGVSGMRSHQTEMDVIGNNIANVNTYAFKSQRTTFRDVYYQTLRNPSEPGDDRGGTNSSQVGYGAQVGSVDTIHTMSGYSPTNEDRDVYINGDGYLSVKKNSDSGTLYTRLGALSFDESGKLVDVNGSMVLGWDNGEGGDGANPIDFGSGTYEDPIDFDATMGDDPISPTDAQPIQIVNFDSYGDITINSDGTITATVIKDIADTGDDVNNGAKVGEVVTVGFIPVANIPNQNALVLEGNSYYRAGNNAGEPFYEVPGAGVTGELVTGGLEMSNVDLANEFANMIITQRGFQANTKIISVVDQMLEELVNLKR